MFEINIEITRAAEIKEAETIASLIGAATSSISPDSLTISFAEDFFVALNRISRLPIDGLASLNSSVAKRILNAMDYKRLELELEETQSKFRASEREREALKTQIRINQNWEKINSLFNRKRFEVMVDEDLDIILISEDGKKIVLSTEYDPWISIATGDALINLDPSNF